MTDYLTVQEVAAHLKVNAKTVRRRIDAGALTATVLSHPGATRRTLRISRDELDRYTSRTTQS